MKIEHFVALSQGEWKSMRSGHSLAFQQFEEILSEIKIEILDIKNPEIQSILNNSQYKEKQASTPFKITWEAESNWEPNNPENSSKGTCFLIPIVKTLSKGELIRSLGYAEKTPISSNYRFLDDGTFTLNTKYENTFCEEKIWFASNNLRCRSSIIFSSENHSILQTSFASEIRRVSS